MSSGFLLDTNVLSELAKAEPHQKVVAAIERFEDQLCTASIVWHELVFGYMRMSDSVKRSLLHDLLFHVLNPTLSILPYDHRAARWHAQERTRLTNSGHMPSFADGQIAAVAATNDLTLVTNNIKDFAGFKDLSLENWHD